MKNKSILILVAIVLFGFVLRLWRVSDLPPSLNWDEVSHGYNAYSILQTGSDEWGQSFPISNFRAYGDYPLPLNLYVTIPFIKAIGLSELAIRLPHVLLGVGTIISAYFLAFGLFKKKEYALLTAFLVSIDPWFLFTSRFVLQSNLAVFFLIAGMASFFNRGKSKYLLPFAIVCLGLTLYSYHSTRIFTPLLLLAMLGVFRKEIVTKATVILMILFFLPLPFILASPEARARSNEVFIVNPGVVAKIESDRNNSSLPIFASRLVYNRPVYAVQAVAKNYIEYFSPSFLFLKGGTQYQFSVPNHGLLYAISLPFFYFGLFNLFTTFKKSKNSQLLLVWLMAAPIPASITTEHFAVLRATPMLPLPELLTCLGLIEFVQLVKRHYIKASAALVPIFVTVSILLTGVYLKEYAGNYTKTYSWAWQYGYKDVALYVSNHYSRYDHIIVTKKYGEPHEFLLFYLKWDPLRYKTDAKLNRYTQSNWWWVDGFDKFVFVNDWQIPHEGELFVTESKQTIDCAMQNCLLVTSPGNKPSGWKQTENISFLDGSSAFELYEN